MKCPICHSQSLSEVSLDTGLFAHQCSECFGHWLSSETYWEWLEQREQQQKAGKLSNRPPISLSTGNGLLPVADNQTANFCADCSHLMTKARVGKGLSFYVDRCSHCHGVWLDQNEWENLKQMNLHHQIHYMFSSTWQFNVRKEQKTYQAASA